MGSSCARATSPLLLVAVVLVGLAVLAAGCGAGDDTTSAPSCEPSSFLPLLQATYDDPDAGLAVVDARVERCRDGYAQVFAVPDDSACEPGVGGCFETEQVFLRSDGETWTILASGTGLTCAEESDPVIAEACRALGYPG